MMSIHDRDRLIRGYAAFSSGHEVDWSFFDPAVVCDQTGSLFLDGVFYGHDGLRAALKEIQADWEDLTLEAEEVLTVGDRVLVMVRVSARVRDSRAELYALVAHVWQFRNGRAVRWDVYGDRAAALRSLRALGLFGTPAQAA